MEVKLLLSERQKLILSSVVDNYIRTAEPIGSRSIAKQGDINYSSATIRNEMADLEEMGFLEQLHTSSGRIPSNKGYRYYVDYLISNKDIEISKRELTNVRHIFTQKFNEVEEVLEQTANILSELTNYTSIILGPEAFNTSLKHLQAVPISDESLVVILVTNSGKVEHKTLSIPEGSSIDEIIRLINLLNMKMVGVPLYKLKYVIKQELHDELMRNFKDYDQSMLFLNELLNTIETDIDNKVYVGGATNLLNQPEFNDIKTIKELFTLFDKSDDVKQLIKNSNHGIEVKIGLENNSILKVNNCSVITANYKLGDQSFGTFGIFGPTRMDYSKVIGILTMLANDFNGYINHMYKK